MYCTVPTVNKKIFFFISIDEILEKQRLIYGDIRESLAKPGAEKSLAKPSEDKSLAKPCEDMGLAKP